MASDFEPTLTPWGMSDEFRARRLPPGPGIPHAEVVESQLERLHGAALAAAAELGHERLRVEDVVRLSGVSRSGFYEHFEDLKDCFASAVDAAVCRASDEAGSDGEDPVEVAVRWADEYPAVVRAALVEAPAAGWVARHAVYLEVERQATLLGRAVPDVPRALAHAIVAGGARLLGQAAAAGNTAGLAGELREWADVVAVPVGLPRWRRAPRRAEPPAPERPRDRVVEAVTTIVGDVGYDALTLSEVARVASCSLTTVYAHFPAGKPDLFAAAAARARTRLLAVAAGVEPQGSVLETVDAALGWLAGRPGEAQLLLVETHPAARDEARRVDDVLGEVVSPIVPHRASVAAAHALAAREVVEGRGHRLRELAPTITYLLWAPVVGADGAAALGGGTLVGEAVPA